MNTRDFAHFYNGFNGATLSGVVHFFLNNLPESVKTRLIAQARLRKLQVVHLVLVVDGNEVLHQTPWPAEADGTPVRPTKHDMLLAAQGLYYLGDSGTIDEVGIDLRNGRLDL